jgi:hypothetical protein
LHGGKNGWNTTRTHNFKKISQKQMIWCKINWLVRDFPYLAWELVRKCHGNKDHVSIR